MILKVFKRTFKKLGSFAFLKVYESRDIHTNTNTQVKVLFLFLYKITSQEWSLNAFGVDLYKLRITCLDLCSPLSHYSQCCLFVRLLEILALTSIKWYAYSAVQWWITKYLSPITFQYQMRINKSVRRKSKTLHRKKASSFFKCV